MRHSDESLRAGADVLVRFCGQVRADDRVLIITDDSTEDVGKFLFDAANVLSKRVNWMRIPMEKTHGMEPPVQVTNVMADSDIIFAATHCSLAHTEARLNATMKGARYLSLPDYNLEQLASPALKVDFIDCARKAKKIKDVLDATKTIEITTGRGTSLKLGCAGRSANFCPGFCARPGALGSPPDIETNIAPMEDGSEGELVVDGSIPVPGIGPIKRPIHVRINGGRITWIDESTGQGRFLKELLDAQSNPNCWVLAEFGVGLNPKARLCGRMLEDEGCLGTIHLGFGSNSTIGGRNRISFHIDFVILRPTVKVDGKLLIDEGTLLLKG